jgi:transposase InsO family protein
LVIARLDRRELVWLNVTAHPTAEWIAQQITEAFPWGEAPLYLIRDNDALYGSAFRRRLRAMGIRDRPIAPGSPWQNGILERLIGSIRRECLDHVLIFSEVHLRRVLREYAGYYNTDRTRRSLKKDAPVSRAVQRAGEIVSRSILGGLASHPPNTAASPRPSFGPQRRRSSGAGGVSRREDAEAFAKEFGGTFIRHDA